MAESRTLNIHTHVIWRQAWQALIDQRWTVLVLVVGFIAIPQLISEWVLASTYGQTLSLLQQLRETGDLNVLQILQALSSGMAFLLFALLINFIFFCMAYIILVNNTLQHLKSQPTTPLKDQLGATLRRLPKTALILFFVFFAYLMVQATLPPLILLIAPIIMAPILYLGSNRSMLKSIAEAASLRYLRKTGLPKLSIYFVLLGYIGFLILSIYLAVWLSEFILNFDTFFPFGFNFVNSTALGAPFSMAHLLFEIMFVHVFGLAMAYFILLKVCFFFFTGKMPQRLPRDGVAI